MATKETTKTIAKAGSSKSIVITLERGTWIENLTSDGWDLGMTKTHLVDRTRISLIDNGKTLAYGDSVKPMPTRHPRLADAIKAGCVGIVGNDLFLQPETADAIREALAELDAENPITAEMATLIAEKSEREAESARYHAAVEAERKERESHPGYCKKCESYCYGDCEAN